MPTSYFAGAFESARATGNEVASGAAIAARALLGIFAADVVFDAEPRAAVKAGRRRRRSGLRRLNFMMARKRIEGEPRGWVSSLALCGSR